MKKSIRLVCILVFMACNVHPLRAAQTPFSNDKIPAIAKIPDGLPWDQDNILKKELDQVNEVKNVLLALTKNYQATPHVDITADSAEEANLNRMIAGINDKRTEYINKINKFNVDVAKAIASPRPTAGPKPTKTVNMSELYTADDLHDAQKRLERLLAFRQWLENEIKKLSDRKKQINNDSKEFEMVRAEAIHHDLSVILSEIPAVGIVKGFSKMSEFSEIITPEFAHQFEAAYGTLSSMASITDLPHATQESDQFKKSYDATLGMQKVMLSFPMNKLPEGSQAKQYLTAMNTLFDSSAKVTAFMLQKKNEESLAQKSASLALDIGSTFPGEVGILAKTGVTAKNEIGRIRQEHIANEALESLGAALGQTWKAELAHKNRLDKVNSDIDEEKRLIEGYKMAHPTAP